MKHFIILFLFLSASTNSYGKDDRWFNGFESKKAGPLKISTWNIADKFIPGGRMPVTVKVVVDEKYHVYADKLKISAVEPQDIDVSEVIISPLVGFVDFAHTEQTGIHKNAQLRFFIQLPDKIDEKTKTLAFRIDYVACTEKFCLPPQNVSLIIGNEEFVANQQSKSQIEGYIESNLFFAFLFILFFGFLTSLTPCVYPLIPITLALIGTRAAQAGKLQAFILSLVYVLGIATTYSLLGVVAAQTGALFGQALSYPPVVISFAIMFFVLSLSMFGYFEIRAPHFVTQKLSTQKTKSGFLGAYLTGLIAGIIASPCVGPVLVGILAYIAKTQDGLLGFALLFTFAMGMGFLFIVLGTFSSLFNKLPKSGAWMDLVKFTLGFAMLVLCFTYLKPIITLQQSFILASALAAFASYIIFRFLVIKSRKTAIVIALIIFTAVNVIGVSQVSHKEELPTATYKNGWKAYSKELIQKAKDNKQPVIIDFFADWCVACTELDEKTFTDAKVIELSKKFMLLKVDATENFEGLSELQTQYKVYGLPTIIFIGSDGNMLADLSLTGFEEVKPFIERMNQSLK